MNRAVEIPERSSSDLSWLLEEEQARDALGEECVALARWVLTHVDSCPPARVRTAQRILVSARVPGGGHHRAR